MQPFGLSSLDRLLLRINGIKTLTTIGEARNYRFTSMPITKSKRRGVAVKVIKEKCQDSQEMCTQASGALGSAIECSSNQAETVLVKRRRDGARGKGGGETDKNTVQHRISMENMTENKSKQSVQEEQKYSTLNRRHPGNQSPTSDR